MGCALLYSRLNFYPVYRKWTSTLSRRCIHFVCAGDRGAVVATPLQQGGAAIALLHRGLPNASHTLTVQQHSEPAGQRQLHE